MDIDLQKLSQIYGNNIIHDIEDELDNLIANIKYLKKLGFKNVEDIIELYPYVFIKDNIDFEEKVNLLIKKVGISYIELLESDTTLWGWLDE